MDPSSIHHDSCSNSVVDRVESKWAELSCDLVQLIFFRLPEASVLKAASVCKRWYSVTQMPSFAECYRKEQNANSCNKFVYRNNGVTYAFVENFEGKGGFLFQPVEKRHCVPTESCLEDGDVPTIEAAGGLHLSFTGVRETILLYKLSLVEKNWRRTPNMPYVVQDPVVGVVEGINAGNGYKIVVAGGLYTASMEDDEDFAVSIYDAQTDSWGYCAPLPSDFRDWRTSLPSMAAVVHKNRFYVYDIYSGLVSWLDLDSKRWSAVVHLRPSAKVCQLFFVSRSGVLHLVGVQDAYERDILFTVWNVVDALEETMRVGEIVHRSLILNPCGAPTSPISRWAYSSMEATVTIIAILLILFVRLAMNCHMATKRAFRFLQGQINSTATVIRQQILMRRLGTE